MAVRTAASTSYTDVNTANGLCVDGDILEIPAGSATWTSTLTVTKAITIRGADYASLTDGNKGTDATTSITANNLLIVQITPTVNATVRILGIKFAHSSYGGSNSLVQIRGSGNGGSVGLTSVRVDHCTFTFGTRALSPMGYVYGVADHCTFTNCNIAYGPNGEANTAWTRSIAAFGTANACFVEDNQFTVNSGATSEPNEWIYLNDGCSAVIRYNTFTGTSYTAGHCLILDTHGNYGNPGAANPLTYRGQPMVEFYNNTVNVYQSYRAFNIRGGAIVFHDNTLTRTTGSNLYLSMTEEDGWETTVVSNPVMTVWPARDQIQMFQWNNTTNGSNITTWTGPQGSDATFIQLNRDFFNRAPQSGDTYYSWASGYSGSTTITVSHGNYSTYTYPHPSVVPPTTPVLVSAAVNGAGTSLTLTFSEACTFGAGGNGGLTMSATAGAVTATYSSGDTTSAFIYSLNRAINAAETITISYIQPTNGIESIALVDLATFTNSACTNGSTQAASATAAIRMPYRSGRATVRGGGLR